MPRANAREHVAGLGRSAHERRARRAGARPTRLGSYSGLLPFGCSVVRLVVKARGPEIRFLGFDEGRVAYAASGDGPPTVAPGVVGELIGRSDRFGRFWKRPRHRPRTSGEITPEGI